MIFTFRLLFLRRFQSFVGSSNLLPVGVSQSKVSQIFSYSTLMRSSLSKKPFYESPQITYLDQINYKSKASIPIAISQRIHQFSPQLNKDTEKSSIPADSTQQKDGNLTKTQVENADIGKDQSQEDESVDKKSQGLLQRFRQTYKEYGKVLVGVHIVTSCIWATSFYYMAVSGVDIIPLLKWLGISDKIIAPLSVPGVGHAAVAVLLYKLATPIRYTVTIAGTRVAVNVLRRWGHLPPIPEENKIRSLVKEGQQKMKERYENRKKSNQEP